LPDVVIEPYFIFRRQQFEMTRFSSRSINSHLLRIGHSILGLQHYFVPAVFLVFAIVLVTRFDLNFRVNDDVWMADVAAGQYLNNPNSNLVFINQPMSGVLSSLYNIDRDIPWYAITLFGATTFPIMVTLWLLLRDKNLLGKQSKLIVTLSSFLLLPSLLLKMTYTTASVSLAVFAVVISLYWLRNRTNHTLLPLLTIVFSIVFSYGLRRDSLVMVAVLAIPSIALILFSGVYKRVMLLMFVSLSSFVGVTTLNSVLLSDDLKSYVAFNDLRGQIHGTSKISDIANNASDQSVVNMLAENNWTINDLHLFNAWYFDDPAVFISDKVQNLLDVDVGRKAESWADSWQTVLSQISVLMLLLVAALTMLLDRRLPVRIYTVFIVGWCLIVSTVIARQRFPDRISISIVLAAVFLIATTPYLTGSLSATDRDQPTKSAPFLLGGLNIFLSIFMTMSFWSIFSPNRISDENRSLSGALEAQIRHLEDIDKNGTFVAVGGGILFQGQDPFRTESIHSRLKILGLGWPIYSPPYEERKRQLGLNSHLVESIVSSKDVYVIASQGAVDLLALYLETRYYPNVTYDVRSFDAGGALVVQFQLTK